MEFSEEKVCPHPFCDPGDLKIQIKVIKNNLIIHNGPQMLWSKFVNWFKRQSADKTFAQLYDSDNLEN